VINLNQN